MSSKIQESQKTENDFSNYCKGSGISCYKLDDIGGQSFRAKYLEIPDSNCPDFLIEKSDKRCFVEVKTLTNFTNAKREKEINTRREFLQKNHRSGIVLNDTIDFYSELWGPFTTFIRSSSRKFKNIRENYKYPRLLLVGGFNVDQIRMSALFHGSYLSYDLTLGKWVGLQKKKMGLFDKIGSSISAVIYWNEDFDRYLDRKSTRLNSSH